MVEEQAEPYLSRSASARDVFLQVRAMDRIRRAGLARRCKNSSMGRRDAVQFAKHPSKTRYRTAKPQIVAKQDHRVEFSLPKR